MYPNMITFRHIKHVIIHDHLLIHQACNMRHDHLLVHQACNIQPLMFQSQLHTCLDKTSKLVLGAKSCLPNPPNHQFGMIYISNTYTQAAMVLALLIIEWHIYYSPKKMFPKMKHSYNTISVHG